MNFDNENLENVARVAYLVLVIFALIILFSVSCATNPCKTRIIGNDVGTKQYDRTSNE